MPRQSLLLDHLAALPCLLAGEFFLACEAGKAAQGPGVYRALKFLHFSELPAEIRGAKGIAKMDQASFWIQCEYWEPADGKTGAGYGKETFTFLSEDAKVDSDFFIFQNVPELIRCPFATCCFPSRAVLEDEVLVAHWQHMKARRILTSGMAGAYVAGSECRAQGALPTKLNVFEPYPDGVVSNPMDCSPASRTGQNARYKLFF